MHTQLSNLRLLDLSFESPAENLACDEALLDELEESVGSATLRFWESPTHFVVLGYSNKLDTEVNRAECGRRDIPILRRSSGGGTVVQGPGCLNYNLTLPISEDTANITATNHFVMDRHRAAFAALLGRDVQIQGCTDLTVDSLKFSGNAQRRKSRALVFHGCFLLNFDLPLIEAVLAHPSSEPDYREGRSHTNFITNLRVSAESVKEALKTIWLAKDPGVAPAPHRIQKLVQERYSQSDWNNRF